jgi:hypothetical protein
MTERKLEVVSAFELKGLFRLAALVDEKRARESRFTQQRLDEE